MSQEAYISFHRIGPMYQGALSQRYFSDGGKGIGRGEISLTSIFMKVSLGSLPILRIPRKKAGPRCLNTAGFQMLGRSLRGNQTPMERSCPSLYVSCDF